MALTRADLRTLVCGWLDDTNQTYFTPSLVNMWLNLAQRQVQFDLLEAGQNWYVIPVETTTVSGQADYILPDDFITLNRLEYVLSGTGPNENRIGITPITLNQQEMVPIVLGNPENYYIKKDRITLMPTPQLAWTLRLYYSYQVQDMTGDTDVPDVPNEFEEFVAVIAAYNGFIKDDRTPENLVAKYKDYQSAMKRLASQRKQDHARTVVQVENYDFGTYY